MKRAHAILLSALLACGCGRAPVPEPPAPSLDEQIAAVRTGRAASITLRAPVESPAAWARLGGLPGLRELVVERGRADDAAAAILATIPDLERVVLRESPVGDEGLARLATLPRLCDLNLPRSAATARGVELLAAGPAGKSLRMLRLGGADLAGADVARAVARLVGLRSLHLIDVPIGDEGLGALAEMPGLWNLYLDGAGVSEGAWGGYFERRPDVHVHVDQVHHDRDPRPAH